MRRTLTRVSVGHVHLAEICAREHRKWLPGPNAPSKTRHEKYPSETGGGNDAFGARSETQRRRDIPRMARNRGISKVHSQITVKTGLAGWGGRIRTCKCQIQDFAHVYSHTRNEFGSSRGLTTRGRCMGVHRKSHHSSGRGGCLGARKLGVKHATYMQPGLSAFACDMS